MPAGNRLLRAKQARSRRLGGGAVATDGDTTGDATSPAPISPSTPMSPSSVGSASDNEESSIEMSAVSTMACVFLLLALGASLASSYVMIHNPGCFGSGTAVGSTPGGVPVAAPGSLRVSPAAAPGGGGGSAVTLSNALARPGFPPKCTPEQLSAIRKQLPPEKCFDQPYTQGCSFTKATTKGCDDNYWIREIYGNAKLDTTYNALFVNVGCRRSEDFIEAIRMGSHDTTLYDTDKWLGKSEKTCRKEVKYGSSQPAYAACITDDKNLLDQVEEGKKALGLDDSKLKKVQAKIGAVAAGDIKTVDSVLPEVSLVGQPIHYMKVVVNDYDTLRGAFNTLEQVRYLEFEYHFRGPWTSGILSDLVKRRLPSKGFVCYFKGTENLWRITDCWLTHYAQKWWANIACVNVNHEDSKPVFNRMEAIFEETLKKDQSFT